MKNKKIIRLVIAATFAAVITALTYFPKIPIPGGGYVHLGDTMIYLAAVILPTPYAITAAAIGGGLADLVSGYANYIPFTIAAKILLALVFSAKSKKILCTRNIIAAVVCIAITPAVYFAADCIFYGVGGALPGIIWNICQAVISMTAFVVIAAAIDKLQLRQKIFKDNSHE